MPSRSRTKYENPLVDRYASKEMSRVWSPQNKFSIWRQLWLALAETEQELGVTAITDEQLEMMRAHLDDINFEAAEGWEKKLRHDVMSHVHAWAEQIPEAQPIIHLGATSCYVGDNTELIQLRQGLELIRAKLAQVIRALRDFAAEWKDLPTLGFTHYQPAQLTTVGKRACLWLQDFAMDYETIDRALRELPFRGAKGTTGTQATFLQLFDGDHEKVIELDRRITERMGFSRSLPVTGQTYTRKIDYTVLSALAAVAQSAYKLGGDVRLLMNLREIDEPFGKHQIGSSAMPYKRNPMRSERICSLARFVMSLPANAADTHANQWFERTLDDSANRRISLPEAFLATDVVLSLVLNISSGFEVWPKVIETRINEYLPFMASEHILMACVEAGGDRQELHEAIRVHSIAAARRMKEEGVANDMLERIGKDSDFAAVHGEIDKLLDSSKFIGRAPQQVDDFLASVIDPLLAGVDESVAATDEVNV
jgi:adenylosuccinate lyase